MDNDDELTVEQATRNSCRRGVVLVRTFSGARYVINLDLMLITRIPAVDDDPNGGLGTPASAPLRRDQQALKILRLHRLAVGERAIFDLEPLGDANIVAFTRRCSTEVLSIEAIDPEPLSQSGVRS